jgi:translation initiation factor IF-2
MTAQKPADDTATIANLTAQRNEKLHELKAYTAGPSDLPLAGDVWREARDRVKAHLAHELGKAARRHQEWLAEQTTQVAADLASLDVRLAPLEAEATARHAEVARLDAERLAKVEATCRELGVPTPAEKRAQREADEARAKIDPEFAAQLHRDAISARFEAEKARVEAEPLRAQQELVRQARLGDLRQRRVSQAIERHLSCPARYRNDLIIPCPSCKQSSCPSVGQPIEVQP